ncbi:MAG: cysteine desulfurase-like protein [Actinomycetota bacterium]|nr:cysteine desulfurase-like protein [Actinomycetota bacterium]
MTAVLSERLQEVRGQFPALSRMGPQDLPVVYADAPGGTQVPNGVVDAIRNYLVENNSNIEGEFAATRETDALIRRARELAGVFVGGHSNEIAFGQNMTTLNFNLSRALGRTLRPGDEIVVTQLDHDANVAPWLLLAADLDLVIRTVRVTAELDVDLDHLHALIGPRTRVVAATLASNAVGTTPRARLISDLAHEQGALAWFDAVAFAPHLRIDVKNLGCDVLLCSPYKFFGPHLGLAWIRRELAETLPAERVRPAAEYPPGHRFETGTLSHEGIAGFCAAVEYIASLGSGAALSNQLDDAYERIAGHEGDLSRGFLDGIAKVQGVTLLGRPGTEGRVCTFGLRLHDADPAAVARALDARGIFAWNGSFYAQGVMEALGLSVDKGILRLGYVHYATLVEIERSIAALDDILRGGC